MNEPIFQLLESELDRHYGLGSLVEYSSTRKGYLCRNYVLRTVSDRFFLKQYRTQDEASVLNMKDTETFFATHGFPVILPLKTKNGNTLMALDGFWYSLFPFVEGYAPRASELTEQMIVSMATTLARMHLVGTQEKPPHRTGMRLWKREDFFRSLHELEIFLVSQSTVSPMQKFALNSLRIQEEYLQDHHETPEDFSLPHNCLLHGDFIYTNLFFSPDGTIEWMFDFERTGVGPRAYELARSIFLTCFDDGWEPRNWALASLFLKTYRDGFAITHEEYLIGARMYAQHFMHMTWLETKVILESSGPHIALLLPARRRTVRFEEGIDEIVAKIWAT